MSGRWRRGWLRISSILGMVRSPRTACGRPRRSNRYTNVWDTTVKQVLHDPQLTMAPINVFTTTNQIDEIFLTSTFCNGRRPDPTSIYALEEKCNGFRANSPYKEVRRLELTHLEDTDSWVLHLKPARLNHRYSIKWKWEKSNVRDRDSSIPDLS